MPTPAFKETPHASRLSDHLASISPEEMAAYIADLKRDAENTKLPAEYRSDCYVHWAIAETRLGRVEDALSHLRLARVLFSHPDILYLLGDCLLVLNRVEEAIDCLAEASDKAPRAPIVATLAAAFYRAGAIQEAKQTFQDAVELARAPLEMWELFSLACQASWLGLVDVTVEYFARYMAARENLPLGDLPAVEFLLQHREQLKLDRLLPGFGLLHSVLHRAMAFELARRAPLPDLEPPQENGPDMFEATRPMREMAAKEHGGQAS